MTTVVELRAHLKRLGLPTTGRKALLEQRLAAANTSTGRSTRSSSTYRRSSSGRKIKPPTKFVAGPASSKELGDGTVLDSESGGEESATDEESEQHKKALPEEHGFFFFCKKYGSVFIVTYLVIEFGLLFLLFLAVFYGLLNTSTMDKLLLQIGHNETFPDEEDMLNNQIIAVASHMPSFALWPFGGIEGLESWNEGFLANHLGVSFHMVGSFIVAYIANKCCEPPRLAVTLAVTPIVAR
jgi:hypothetical protein